LLFREKSFKIHELMHHIVEFLTLLIVKIIEASGYFGVFTLMTFESALIPIPSEITMTFSGFLASEGKMSLFTLCLVGGFANLIGSLLAYWLGFWGQEHFVRTLIKKYGKFILVSEDEFDKSMKWFKKYGESIAFFSRLMPIVRTFISLPCGIAKMNLWKFSYLTLIGAIIWSFILANIGFILGSNWSKLEVYYRKYELLIGTLLIGLVIYFIWHKIKKIKGCR